MSDDYHDMLCALKNANVEFLVVGAHALGAHGIVRGTLDFDIWVRPSPDNAKHLWNALVEFGAPMDHIEPADFEKPDLVLQIGVAPNRIDLMTSITAVDFSTAWKNRIEVNMHDLAVPVIGKQQLIRNKRATHRPRDLEDADDLEHDRTKG